MQGACDESMVRVTHELDVAAETCPHIEVLDGDVVPPIVASALNSTEAWRPIFYRVGQLGVYHSRPRSSGRVRYLDSELFRAAGRVRHEYNGALFGD